MNDILLDFIQRMNWKSFIVKRPRIEAFFSLLPFYRSRASPDEFYSNRNYSQIFWMNKRCPTPGREPHAAQRFNAPHRIVNILKMLRFSCISCLKFLKYFLFKHKMLLVYKDAHFFDSANLASLECLFWKSSYFFFIWKFYLNSFYTVKVKN